MRIGVASGYSPSAASEMLRNVQQNGKLGATSSNDGPLRATVLAMLFDQIVRSGRLYTLFQPIVRAGDDLVEGFELLARAPEHLPQLPSYVPPPTPWLVETAHRQKRLAEVEEILLRTAMCGLRPYLSARPNALFFINCDLRVMNDPRWDPASVVALVDEYGIPRSRIVLEITETYYGCALSQMRTVIDGWRRAGLKIALDDVGAHPYTLTALSALEPDIVKIDRSIVRDVAHRAVSFDAISEIVERGHRRDQRIVAEGVETETVLSALRRTAVDSVQGYLTGRPRRVPSLAPVRKCEATPTTPWRVPQTSVPSELKVSVEAAAGGRSETVSEGGGTTAADARETGWSSSSQ